jgi:hypothetical protein
MIKLILNINYHDTLSILFMGQYIYEERKEIFIMYERSVIIIKLLWHSYLVHSLRNWTMKLSLLENRSFVPALNPII